MAGQFWENDELRIAFDQVNPKSHGTAPYDRYEKYKTATNMKDAKAAGFTKADLKNDHDKGFFKIVTDESFVPASDEVKIARLAQVKRELASPVAAMDESPSISQRAKKQQTIAAEVSRSSLT